MSVIIGSLVVGFSILLLPPLNLGAAATGVLLGVFVLLVASVDRDVNVLACLFDGFLSCLSFPLCEVLVLWNFFVVESIAGPFVVIDLSVVGPFAVTDLSIAGAFVVTDLPVVDVNALGRNRLDVRDCSAIGFSIVAILSER